MSLSEHNTTSRLVVTSNTDVQLTIYDAIGSRLHRRDGAIDVVLPHGLYRVQFERTGLITTRLIDHYGATEVRDPGPELSTPTLVAEAITSHDYYTEPAELFSTSDTGASLGQAPHGSRLFVFLRREARDRGPQRMPSEPVTIHDATGRELARICPQTSEINELLGYVAYSAQVASGTYRLRARRARRDIAITIPEGYAAHVFIADDGRVRLEDLRISLRPLGARFDSGSTLQRAMEAVVGALGIPGRELPTVARALLPGAIDDDLCFGIAATHLLWRARESSMLHLIISHLTRCAEELPDVAILGHAWRQKCGEVGSAPNLSAPPLFRASMVMAMTQGQFHGLNVDLMGAIVQAARTGYHDSIWCTWSDRVWDGRWIEPTIDKLRRAGQDGDVLSIARAIAIPTRIVDDTIEGLDATLPSIGGVPARTNCLRVPGYMLGEVLGRGSQGVVFYATRESDGRAVALKVVPLLGSAEQCRRVVRELEIVHDIDHPRILTPVACGALAEDAGVWFELELCRGSVLDLVSETDAPLSVAHACEIVLQGLEGLVYLHARGIVHRDLKPGNLLVREDGSVAIADLGIAKQLDTGHLTATGRAGGTARFAPREQLLDFKRASPASDVWSMAATLYFLLTLDLPRDTYADQGEFEAALENPVVSLAERSPELPSSLVCLVDNSLSDDLALRPADAASLRFELTLTVAALARA